MPNFLKPPNGAAPRLRFPRCQADPEPRRRIQLKHTDRRAADGGDADDSHVGPHEMLIPSITARMIKRHDLPRLRVDARQVATFVQITLGARQGQIIEVILTAVLTGNDVLDMERD